MNIYLNICALLYIWHQTKPFFMASGQIFCEDDFFGECVLIVLNMGVLSTLMWCLWHLLQFSGLRPSVEICDSCGGSVTDLVSVLTLISTSVWYEIWVTAAQSGPAGPWEVVPPGLFLLRRLQTGAAGPAFCCGRDSHCRIYCVGDYHR